LSDGKDSMKPAYVADLTPDQNITSYYLVFEKEVRSTREGKAYLRLELGDRTGTVEARMWDRFEESSAAISRDDFVKVQARVDVYRNRPQLILEKLRKADASEVEPADFYATTKADVNELWARLREHVAGIRDANIRQFVEAVLDDPEIGPRFRRAPAAKTMHHAYIGGLLEHVVSLCDLSAAVSIHYPEANRDFLLAGAVLHDVGKVYELSYERALGYTTEGQLVGHIVIAVEIIAKKAGEISGFPQELATLLKHMVLSHHGHYEFGSPKLPMFREAVMLHFLDDLDSKMGAMSAMLASDRGEPGWTERGAALERRLLRVDDYLPSAKQETAPEQLKLDSSLSSAKGTAVGERKGF
jgi:3'-5' exoribonuclease